MIALLFARSIQHVPLIAKVRQVRQIATVRNRVEALLQSFAKQLSLFIMRCHQLHQPRFGLRQLLLRLSQRGHGLVQIPLLTLTNGLERIDKTPRVEIPST
ncbi:hypothetical protein PMI12_03931 [Variovorax sp. CF313]|nr:hypothetical protein PMI12_03931 [Variovorax sp. CF313]